MLPKRLLSGKRFSSAALVLAVWATAAVAGTNAGFTASITSPTSVRNPQVGQVIELTVAVQGAVSAKGMLLTVKYDADLFSFDGFAPSRFIRNLRSLPGTPILGEDGLTTTEEGGTQLGSSTTPASGSGVLGTLSFTVTGEIPLEGTHISVLAVQLNASATDTDDLLFPPGTFGIRFLRVFPNALFDFIVERFHNRAFVTWSSTNRGLDDQILYRPVDTATWLTATNPLKTQYPTPVVDAFKRLVQGGIDPATADSAHIQQILGTPLDAASFRSLRDLAFILNSRRHRIPLTGLQLNTQYEYTASSVGILGQLSASYPGTFLTRAAPDLRPLALFQFDVQPGVDSALLRWFTDRPADTRYVVALVDSAAAPGGEAATALVRADTLDEQGANVHIAELTGLLPGRTYSFSITSRRVGVDDLVTGGQLTEFQARTTRTGTFRTRGAALPLRFLGPPHRVIGSTSAVIDFQLNQPVEAFVDFGPLSSSSAQTGSAVTYTDTAFSGEVLTAHSIVLSGLEPSVVYRYRIRVLTAGGDSINTDPRGNSQWSRDLQFTTSVESDTLPPEIVEGPLAITRRTLAILHWSTDVPTTGSVFFGSLGSGGTLGTADEVEIVDLTPSGAPRFDQKHVITITGLTRRTNYGFRIESVAANGRTAIFDPLGSLSSGAAKLARALQPPGGAGSFTTTNTVDTQFPVILSGPTITSKTHDTAVVEWTTDEPADSEARFGAEGLDESVTSGDNELSHKLVVSNLDPGTSYSYVVGSTDASGNGATESSPAIFTTDPEVDLTAPAIIQGPTVVYKSDRSATIQWTTDEDATAQVDFGTTSALGFVRTSSATAQVHELALTNLNPGTQYSYKVSSADLSNNGPTQSAVLTFTTDSQADLTSPVLSSISATPTNTTAIIRWTTDEQADSFVDFGTAEGQLDTKVGDVADVTAHELVLTNLTASTQYFYTVGSIDRANNPLTQSAVLSFTTLGSADLTPPATPASLRGTAGSGQAILTWTANTEVDLAGYNVYRRTGAADFAAIATRIAQAAYTDQGLANGTAYEYRITAIDRNATPNESSPTSALSVTPTASASPSAPTGLTRQGDVLQPTLVFADATPVTAGAALTYTIQVSTQPDFSDVTTSTSDLVQGSGGAGTGKTAWTISRTLEEGGIYYWRVRAVEGALVGAFSETQQFTAREGITGDFDGDNSVTFDDFFLFVDVFGQSTSSSNAKFDLNGGGTIDFDDFFIFVDNFGKSASGKRWASTEEIDTRTRLSLEALAAADASQVLVRVWAEQVEQLRAFGLVLNYDPQAVEFLGASQGSGPLLESRGGTSPLFRVLAQTPGELVIGNGITAGEPVSGQGLLAELRFRPAGALRTTRFALQDAFVARSGAVRRVQQVGAVQLLPRVYSLAANFPNPFNPSTTIAYALPQAGPVALRIYDILGQQVRNLVVQEDHPAGFYTATWDGQDSAGRAVGNGLYFYRLETPHFTQVRKMMLIK